MIKHDLEERAIIDGKVVVPDEVGVQHKLFCFRRHAAENNVQPQTAIRGEKVAAKSARVRALAQRPSGHRVHQPFVELVHGFIGRSKKRDGCLVAGPQVEGFARP
eukprot:Amastigsp_a509796_52.p4 type:complete len:105 gc:universal Amastigsp_a509796_52:976-662(-)